MNKRNEQPAALRKALRTRCLSLAKITGQIKSELERDCLSYWKLDCLRDDLMDLADDLREFI